MVGISDIRGDAVNFRDREGGAEPNPGNNNPLMLNCKSPMVSLQTVVKYCIQIIIKRLVFYA